MEKVRVEDVPGGSTINPAAVFRRLGWELGTSDLAINYYELEPGGQFGYGYHCHHDQEEVFVVLEGTVTFQTADGDVEVGSMEVIRFGTGEFQLGRNRTDRRVVALALGAPRGTTRLEYRHDCPECGERTTHTPRLRSGLAVLHCSQCRSANERVDL